MSSKILSGPEAKSWRSPHSGQKSRKEQTLAGEFRGLPNRAIITLVLALVAFGLMAVFSASAPEALQSYQDSTIFLRRQGMAAAIGIFLMFWMSRYDYRNLRKWAWPITLVCIGLLGLTMIPGFSVTASGSTRWIAVGAFRFQPSEFAKVTCIILMASGLSKYFWWHRQIFLRLIVILLIAGVVVKQPDLGTSMMIMGTLLAMLYVSGTNSLLIFSAVAGGAAVVWHHIQRTPYQLARIQTWLNPYSAPQAEGWNIIQSHLAIGSGGLWGAGFGGSLQKLYYLPVQHADFIFAVIAEEFGFVGCLALISLFVMLAYYGFRTALDARSLFGRFLAIGITSSITMQALVNIMVTTGLLPVTGITLPFISYGGSSIVITLAMVGILLSISRDRGQFDEDEEFAIEPAPGRTT